MKEPTNTVFPCLNAQASIYLDLLSSEAFMQGRWEVKVVYP